MLDEELPRLPVVPSREVPLLTCSCTSEICEFGSVLGTTLIFQSRPFRKSVHELIPSTGSPINTLSAAMKQEIDAFRKQHMELQRQRSFREGQLPLCRQPMTLCDLVVGDCCMLPSHELSLKLSNTEVVRVAWASSF